MIDLDVIQQRIEALEDNQAFQNSLIEQRLISIDKRLGQIEKTQMRHGRILFGDSDMRTLPILNRIENAITRVEILEERWKRIMWTLIGYGAAGGGIVALIVKSLS